jgi:3'-phosphoadenosine 5'-phosphosulfate sulfotransferase (PAPS reductase)/FAD synthetase
MNKYIISTSGGKDSTALVLLAVERHGIDSIYPVFADTGNENKITLDYLEYLEGKIGKQIVRIKASFDSQWWGKRDYIRDRWPSKGVPPNIVLKALELFEKGPTGIPFLDLAIIKSRFPSRMAAFCTQVLKKQTIEPYVLSHCGPGISVESWMGVRADESPNRAKLPARESAAGLYTIVRPILLWTVEQVFDMHKKYGIDPNPLYKMGFKRVGCMPCVNVCKGELNEIWKRFPEHVKKIQEWESVVGLASKREHSTFLFHPDGKGTILDDVEWSKTVRGGKQYDMLPLMEETHSCSSEYGLCE